MLHTVARTMGLSVRVTHAWTQGAQRAWSKRWAQHHQGIAATLFPTMGPCFTTEDLAQWCEELTATPPSDTLGLYYDVLARAMGYQPSDAGRWWVHAEAKPLLETLRNTVAARCDDAGLCPMDALCRHIPAMWSNGFEESLVYLAGLDLEDSGHVVRRRTHRTRAKALMLRHPEGVRTNQVARHLDTSTKVANVVLHKIESAKRHRDGCWRLSTGPRADCDTTT